MLKKISGRITRMGAKVKRLTLRLLSPFVPGLRFYCPICRIWFARFQDHGIPPRPNIRCPQCGSLDRHRLDWVFLNQGTDLLDGRPKRVLHVAPERWLEPRLRRVPGLEYISADLNNPRAMVKMDITDIQFPDDHFSAIYCSHVLEHVPDDHKALSEFYRVLRPGGWALLQVPIRGKKSWDGPELPSAERARRFGQADHVRNCGPDYIERMRAAGFDGQALRAQEVLSREMLKRMSISGGRWLFFCRKPQDGDAGQ